MLYRVGKATEGYDLIEGPADPQCLWDDILRSTAGTVPSPSFHETVAGGWADMQELFVTNYDKAKNEVVRTLS